MGHALNTVRACARKRDAGAISLAVVVVAADVFDVLAINKAVKEPAPGENK